MATNGITSGKVPRRRGNSPLREAGVPMYVGDNVYEKANGEMAGRLQFAQAQPVAGITTTTENRLLRQAGITIRRNTA